MTKVFSCDAEVDGLYGPSIAIAATVREKGVEIARFEARVPDELASNDWVIENVLPAIKDMPVTHADSESMEEAFWDFWMLHKADSTAIAHCGSPVESGLFRRCVERDLEARQWEGPYPAIHEVATLLEAVHEDAASVDAYIRKYSLNVPFQGEAHHPLYDSLAAAIVWEHASSQLQ